VTSHFELWTEMLREDQMISSRDKEGEGDMTDIKARLTEAADYLDNLYEGSRYIPGDLIHSEAQRGLVKALPEDAPDATRAHPVAQFFYDGAAEVFLALGPAALPLLADVLRTEASEEWLPGAAAVALANHILKEKERQT
jgi:hypothetical protein